MKQAPSARVLLFAPFFYQPKEETTFSDLKIWSMSIDILLHDDCNFTIFFHSQV